MFRDMLIITDRRGIFQIFLFFTVTVSFQAIVEFFGVFGYNFDNHSDRPIGGARMKKGKRAGGYRLVVLLLLAVCLALAAISCALALRLYRRTDPALVGSWRMRVDLTEDARTRANAWLWEAELGDRIDAGGALPRIEATVLLSLGKDGIWTRRVEETSYEAARAQAVKALAVSLRELLRLRTAEAGREAGNAELAETRIEKAIGMSSERYLADRGPALLPALAELRARYDGSGAYQIEGHSIRFDGQTARYLADEMLLVIDGGNGTEVYERAGN